MSYRNGLVEGSAVAMAGLEVVSSQYALSCFLGMGGHFARLVIASDAFATRIDGLKRKPPKHIREYNEALLSYVLSDHLQERRAHRSKKYTYDDLDANVSSKLSKRATEFYNFVFYYDLGKAVHYYESPHPCRGYDALVTASRSREFHRDVLLPGIPEKLESGKWTKLGASNDFQLHARLEDSYPTSGVPPLDPSMSCTTLMLTEVEFLKRAAVRRWHWIGVQRLPCGTSDPRRHS